MTKPVLTIPTCYYTDPTFYELEKEKIFWRTWQFVCHTTDISEAGSFWTTDIAGESIVVVHGMDGQVRAFFNVCRHRGHRLTEADGVCTRLVCPYHAWAYDLDGTLSNARGTDDVEGFDKADYGLKAVRVESFCGLLFVNLDADATPLGDLHPGLREEILEKQPRLESMIRVHSECVPHACNWKVSVENYNECYHCPVAHKYIVSNLYSADEYRITVENDVVRHFSPRLEQRDVHGDLIIWSLWPNLSIQCQPIHHSVSIRHFRGVNHRQSVYDYLWFIDPDLPAHAKAEVLEMGQKTYASTNAIEDQMIVKNVQLGLESRGYERGPLVLKPGPASENEHAVAFFQSRYLQTIESLAIF
jgi:phenylpropionate dioxygenase-like ring-hydroxylating dioxygenase large terminal subunit